MGTKGKGLCLSVPGWSLRPGHPFSTFWAKFSFCLQAWDLWMPMAAALLPFSTLRDRHGSPRPNCRCWRHGPCFWACQRLAIPEWGSCCPAGCWHQPESQDANKWKEGFGHSRYEDYLSVSGLRMVGGGIFSHDISTESPMPRGSLPAKSSFQGEQH